MTPSTNYTLNRMLHHKITIPLHMDYMLDMGLNLQIRYGSLKQKLSTSNKSRPRWDGNNYTTGD